MLVIPADAGIQESMAEERVLVLSRSVVIWIPAFAGMTAELINAEQ